LAIPDPAPADPSEQYAQGYRYAVRFINKKNQTAGLSNQAFIAPVAIPAAPTGLSYTVTADRILLAWNVPSANADGSSPARVAGYNVYRSSDPEAFPPEPLNATPLLKPEYEDRNFEFDQRYYYAVTVVGKGETPYAESLPTPALAVTPRDTFPPGAPKNLSYVLQNGTVTLLWEPPDDADLLGYRVFREESDGSGRVTLQDEPIMALSFRDDKAAAGKKYQYSVVAVDRKGNAGQPAIVQVEVQ
jgi:fibronectin type 3 domain-containing protein